MPTTRWLQIILSLVFMLIPHEARTIKGLESEIRHLYICKGQPRNFACGGGGLIWIRSATVGITYSHDECGKSSARARACQKSTYHYHQLSTSPTDTRVDVPNDSIRCGGTNRSVNYAHIRYSCIDSSQLNPQDMCARSTRVYRDDYITTPGFPSPAPNQLYDCTCHIQSVQRGILNVSVMVVYANLPHGHACAEETWIENQVGSRIDLDEHGGYSSLCSNGTFMLLSNRLNHESLTLRFVRNRQTVTGNSKLKIWYALQAEAEMRVTCGPTIVTTTISPTRATTPTTTTTTPTVTTTASFPFEVDAQGSEMHPGGTIMTREVSLPADDSVLDKNVVLFIIIGCVVFVVAQTILMVWCIKKKRSAKQSDGLRVRTSQYHHGIPEVYLSMDESTLCGHRSRSTSSLDKVGHHCHDTHGRSLSAPFIDPYRPHDFATIRSLPIHSVARLAPHGHTPLTVGQSVPSPYANRFGHATLASADCFPLNGQATLPVRQPLPTPYEDQFNHATLPSVDRCIPNGHTTLPAGQPLLTPYADQFSHATLPSLHYFTPNGHATLPYRQPRPTPYADQFVHATLASADRVTPYHHSTLGNGHTLPAPCPHRCEPQSHTTNAAGHSRQSTNDGYENPYTLVLGNGEYIGD